MRSDLAAAILEEAPEDVYRPFIGSNGKVDYVNRRYAIFLENPATAKAILEKTARAKQTLQTVKTGTKC